MHDVRRQHLPGVAYGGHVRWPGGSVRKPLHHLRRRGPDYHVHRLCGHARRPVHLRRGLLEAGARSQRVPDLYAVHVGPLRGERRHELRGLLGRPVRGCGRLILHGLPLALEPGSARRGHQRLRVQLGLLERERPRDAGSGLLALVHTVPDSGHLLRSGRFRQL